MLVVNVLDGRFGPVQYLARWIDKERRLQMLRVPHLGHTSMMVTTLASFSKQYLSMLIWGQTGGIVVKSKTMFWEGDKQDIFFTRKIQIDRSSWN